MRRNGRGAGRPVEARPTLRSLAEQLRLSPASVSLVLNHAPAARAIPKATQDRIRAAAARAGYRPNTIAKSLRHRRTRTIGVMVPEISEGYSATVMSGIEDALLQAGYLYFVASHRHRRDLLDEYPRLMLDRAVDGLIVREMKNGSLTLAELNLGIDADTPLYWAVALENPGTHQVRVSEVRSFVAPRKFMNRVAPAPWQPVTRKGTLSASELSATQWEHGLAKGEAPHIRLNAGYDFQPLKAAPVVPAELSSKAVRLAQAIACTGA